MDRRTDVSSRDDHPVTPEQLREAVRRRYADAARRADGEPAGCGCGCSPQAESVVSRDLYAPDETEGVPEAAIRASLGCGNPTALADLRPGEVVLDLGSGGGIDVLMSARRVGPEGKAYGLDMTAEMLELARRNQAEAGVTNAEFLEGQMEDVPLPDDSVDVVISNCVINLSTDKSVVLQEAARVLRPGGRFAVSDIVTTRPMPENLRSAVALWSACMAGALEIDDYRARLADAGFEDVDIEVTRTWRPDDVDESADEFLRGHGLDPALFDGLYASASVRARKPS